MEFLTSRPCRAASAKGKSKEKGKGKVKNEDGAKEDLVCGSELGVGYAALAAQRRVQKRPGGILRAKAAKEENQVITAFDCKENLTFSIFQIVWHWAESSS